LNLTWDEWLTVNAPFENVDFSVDDVTARYSRNGYDWDMHGTLYTPKKEVNSHRAFVCFHGGAGSEKIMDFTPDGRPGLARVLASQGFKALALTYPGHYPPGGVWQQPIPERMPFYLLDRELPVEEIKDRNLKCTFNTILQGAGLLTDQHLSGREILGFGHSTGGPMAAHLTRFSQKTKSSGWLDSAAAVLMAGDSNGEIKPARKNTQKSRSIMSRDGRPIPFESRATSIRPTSRHGEAPTTTFG